MVRSRKSFFVVVFALSLSACSFFSAGKTDGPFNVVLNKPVEESSVHQNYVGEKAVDGDWTEQASRWISLGASSAPHSLEIDLQGAYKLVSADVWTGVYPGQTEHVVPDLKLQYWTGGAWVDIPGASIEGNDEELVRFEFSESVVAERVRFYSNVQSQVRVREILIYGEAASEN